MRNLVSKSTILVSLFVLAACAGPEQNTSTPTATTMPTAKPVAATTPAEATIPPTPTATVPPPTHTPTPPTHTPLPTPSPSTAPAPTLTPTPAPIEGYWIQNTAQDGLCSNNPRFIGHADTYNRAYLGGDGGTICYFDYFGLEWWTRDFPSPIFGFPSWITVNVPQIGRITGGTSYSPYAPPNPPVPSYPGVYGMPSFVGSGGQCIMDDQGEWHCFTASRDSLPFDDIRGYGIVQDSNVEWFMSAESVASRGLPQEQFYSIPELVDAEGARATWLNVPYQQGGSVWVSTDSYGVLRIQPEEQRVTRYTVANGLPDDEVRDVQACGEECVWVATAGGVGYWDGQAWRAYSTGDGLPSNDVYGVSFTRSGIGWFDNLWAATAGGPALLVRGNETWQSFPNFPAGVEVNGVQSNVFSTRGQGVLRFVQSPVARGRTTSFTMDDGLPDDQITALAATANGILVGTPLGAVEGDGHTWTLITSAAINDAASDALATDEGLWLWQSSAWEQVSAERVTLVSEGGWYATPGQVCRWVDGAPYCPPTADGQELAGVQVLHTVAWDYRLIAVGLQGRYWYYDTQECSPGCFMTPAILHDHAPRKVNDLVVTTGEWLCATDEGVYDTSFAGSCDPGETLGDFTLAGGWPLAVRGTSLEATTSTVWIVTSQGAFYSQAEDKKWTYVDGLAEQELSAVLALPDGTAWFGTTDAGLIHFEP